MWPRVVAAAGHIEALRRKTMVPENRAPERRHFYGLLPPSISHEGYSAKPMHSYWDDFWALAGLKDAAWLAERAQVATGRARKPAWLGGIVAALLVPAAVLCLRGGYGSGRLLDRIDPALLRAHDKPFVGYSDITALHALRAREGLPGLHAPMPASDRSRSTSAAPKPATTWGSKPANAARNAGRLRRIVAHDSPDWNASSDRRSNTPRSSRTGIPHSVS